MIDRIDSFVPKNVNAVHCYVGEHIAYEKRNKFIMETNRILVISSCAYNVFTCHCNVIIGIALIPTTTNDLFSTNTYTMRHLKRAMIHRLLKRY